MGTWDYYGTGLTHLQASDLSCAGDKIPIKRGGDTLVTISKWFRVRDSYGVEVAAGEDVPLSDLARLDLH